MKFKRILAITIKYGFLLKRNKQRFIALLAWPILDIFVWGATSIYLDEINKLNFNFTTVFLSATILWALLTRSQQGVMSPMLEDVWGRNLFNLFASPLKIGEYVLGLLISATMIFTLTFFIMLGVAYLIFGYNIFQLGFMLIPFLISLFIFGLSLGVFTTGIVLRYGPSVEFLVWIAPSALAPLSSIYYPVSILPATIRPFAKIIPTSYIFEGLRSVLSVGVFSGKDLFIGFLLSIIYLVASYWYLIYVYKLVLRNGFLARFSAESM